MKNKILISCFIFFLFSALTFSNEQVLNGLDVLEKQNFNILKNKNIGLITNHSAINKEGKNIVEIFRNKDINLKAIFSPEHGFSGEVEGGLSIENSTNTQIPIYSLYGKIKRPTKEMLNGIDILIFDIQDIGARFYTYLTTMGYAMEEAEKYNIKFIVLDRVNPIGLSKREGPVLSKDINKFTAYYKIPIRHGLTAGEIALLHKKRHLNNLNLEIIKIENYNRNIFFDETKLLWINPSPNIRDLTATLLYPGLGCFEATNISVGRGTDIPFHWFGAPWLNVNKILKKLNKTNIKGVKFERLDKTPNSDLYENQLCKGIEIKITNEKEVNAVELFVNISYYLRKYNKKNFIIKEDEIKVMTGNDSFYNLLNKNKKPKEILNNFKKSIDEFNKEIKDLNILLY